MPCRSRRSSTSVGRAAERRAERFLRRRGLELVQRNYRCRWGEIDLIMRQRDVLVFVEVRHRAGNARIPPLETVTAAKQRRLKAAAAVFLSHVSGPSTPRCRFDVVGTSPARSPLRRPQIIWREDAFR